MTNSNKLAILFAYIEKINPNFSVYSSTMLHQFNPEEDSESYININFAEECLSRRDNIDIYHFLYKLVDWESISISIGHTISLAAIALRIKSQLDKGEIPRLSLAEIIASYASVIEDC